MAWHFVLVMFLHKDRSCIHPLVTCASYKESCCCNSLTFSRGHLYHATSCCWGDPPLCADQPVHHSKISVLSVRRKQYRQKRITNFHASTGHVFGLAFYTPHESGQGAKQVSERSHSAQTCHCGLGSPLTLGHPTA